jgi:dTDP-4-dehydrorhamnose 3,5-epimerase
VRFEALPIAGAYLIEPDRLEDQRGFFARTWCREELAARGLVTELAQCSISFNRRKGTLRGMHYQVAPHEETKIVRCTMGALWDVLVDLRPDSPTYRQWTAAELTAENRRQLYIPAGCAHGFQTLTDDTEVLYLISESYHPESARGVRWDDPKLGIAWPLPVSAMSDRDRAFRLLE